MANSHDCRSREPGSHVRSILRVTISLPLCTTSPKGEGVDKAIVRPEERDQQILTEGILAGEEGHVGFPELKPQDHNREETLKYMFWEGN